VVRGKIEVISGPMMSGKTTELIRRITREKLAGNSIIVFKPNIDDRYNEDKVVSHTGDSVKCQIIPIHNTEDIYESALKYDVVAIDEAQFFNCMNFIEHINVLANKKYKKVIIAGLDTDFEDRPFGYMPEILAIADDVTKLTAICDKCGEEATKTYRKIDNDEQVLVGDNSAYEPLCRKCRQKAREGDYSER